MKKTLLESKIKNKKANVAVIGLGYVGLPLALAFAKKGFKVFGIDTSTERISRINSGKSYITDVEDREIAGPVRRKTFTVSTAFDLLKEADVIIICVPTPIKRKYT